MKDLPLLAVRAGADAELLAGVLYPGIVTQAFRANLTDARLTTPKSWRDVYRHDDAGRVIGWTRHEGTQATAYHADGQIIVEKDAQGRPTRCRSVRYEAVDPKRSFFDWQIKPVAGNEILHYEYDGPTDWLGKIVKREPTP